MFCDAHASMRLTTAHNKIDNSAYVLTNNAWGKQNKGKNHIREKWKESAFTSKKGFCIL